MGDADLQRSGHVLYRKLRKYLIPTIVTALAMSLDEFVDSIIVANLLDLKSMTVISVASPIVLVIAAIYILFGIGGSTVYALNLGQRNTKAAGKAFSVSFLSAMLFAVLLLAGGLSFLKPVCSFLCKDESLMPELLSYFRILLITAPFVIGIQTLSMFLPAAGGPDVATLICIIANVFNLLFDYIYIRFFHLGVGGTALATLTGYVVCLVILSIMLLRKKICLYAVWPAWNDFSIVREIIEQGGASALTQIGYTVKFAFFNRLTLALGGTVALEVFAVAKQLLSIMGIGLAGIADAVSPFMSVLMGQHDMKGIKYILRRGEIYVLLSSGIMVLIFEIFPQILFWMFNVKDPAVISMATKCVRIFLLLFLFRGIYILYMDYARISGRTSYASVISLLDGFVLIIPVGLVLSRLFGLTGVWLSFPIASILILLGMILYNSVLAKRSNGRLSGLFLLENEENVRICDMTISEENETIASMSEALTEFCRENGVEENKAIRIGLIAEEMAVYTRLHRKTSDQIDILTRITDDIVTVDFRSSGTPFNPLAKSEEDSDENIQLINKIPSDIEYDYILGLNSTRFTISKEERLDHA